MTDFLRINGPQKLKGEVKISGAKNSALKLMAASVLTNNQVVITNAPKIADVLIMQKVLSALGIKAEFNDGNIIINASNITSNEAPFSLVNKMRASILVLGPLIARTGSARIALPGGCRIGLRKINYHIRGLELMGAKVRIGKGFIEAKCTQLKATKVSFDFPSVGATENIMMAAVMAKGTTVIENAAREPEIIDLAKFLNSMGARVRNAGESTISIDGVEKIGGTQYSVMPDRIEAGTFAFAVAMTQGDVVLNNISEEDLRIVIDKLKETGIEVKIKGKNMRVKGKKKVNSTDFVTLPYPGFPTDLQAPAMALMSIADNASMITENVFENRFGTAKQLISMGADIEVHEHHAVIKGVDNLKGSKVKVPDLRGGAALVIAALAAEGESEIDDVFHIERGYEDFVKKLLKLNVKLELN